MWDSVCDVLLHANMQLTLSRFIQTFLTNYNSFKMIGISESWFFKLRLLDLLFIHRSQGYLARKTVQGLKRFQSFENIFWNCKPSIEIQIRLEVYFTKIDSDLTCRDWFNVFCDKTSFQIYEYSLKLLARVLCVPFIFVHEYFIKHEIENLETHNSLDLKIFWKLKSFYFKICWNIIDLKC